MNTVNPAGPSGGDGPPVADVISLDFERALRLLDFILDHAAADPDSEFSVDIRTVAERIGWRPALVARCAQIISDRGIGRRVGPFVLVIHSTEDVRKLDAGT